MQKEAASSTRAAPTTRKDLSMIAPEPSYQTSRTAIWVLFDLRDKGAVQSLHSQRAALAELGDLAAIDQDHIVLIVLPGGARRLI
jgi:hypothetical protein